MKCPELVPKQARAYTATDATQAAMCFTHTYPYAVLAYRLNIHLLRVSWMGLTTNNAIAST